VSSLQRLIADWRTARQTILFSMVLWKRFTKSVSADYQVLLRINRVELLLSLFCFCPGPHEDPKPIVCLTHLGLTSGPLALPLSCVLWPKVLEHVLCCRGSERQSLDRIPLRPSNTPVNVTTSTPAPLIVETVRPRLLSRPVSISFDF
jgi:hypothetical protein